MDEDGYPTDEETWKIEGWEINGFSDCTDLLKYVKPLWKYADMGYWGAMTIQSRGKGKGKHTKYSISTGGWSGNETLLSALESNMMFWMLCWYSSRRGGHYTFEVKDE